ncbi:hypothetical protein E2C01_091933 [Portunus trituberculatus]|uniref:Uncharacterized protein n=1 Tax=Portunus trituberculatus TaxID=210409 RepID=A0A5B7JKC1_PORTR|nr:hypothetical protein [Portunus trituberculatus]
MTLPTHGPP